MSDPKINADALEHHARELREIVDDDRLDADAARMIDHAVAQIGMAAEAAALSDFVAARRLLASAMQLLDDAYVPASRLRVVVNVASDIEWMIRGVLADRPAAG